MFAEGPIHHKFAIPALDSLQEQHPEVLPGGAWQPPDCTAVQRVAIIIPYRDRREQLLYLLSVLHTVLQKQQLEYRIIVAEQNSPRVFNKAMLMNAGYNESVKFDDFDCFVFHDVDVIPLDDLNFYTCADQPRHVGAYMKKFNFTYVLCIITLYFG